MSAAESEDPEASSGSKEEFSAAEIGALAHLYRAEIYRSTAWRTRLDSTTNWAVVTTGIALSTTFSSVDASPEPMVLIGFVVSMFLMLEARRYRYFNVWRARARLMETHFYAPLLRGAHAERDSAWAQLLADDLRRPGYHISFSRAIGRRLRRTYGWILLIQALAYYGKIAIHPTPLATWAQLWERASIGPIPGRIVIFSGVLFHLGWLAFALITLRLDKTSRRHGPRAVSMG